MKTETLISLLASNVRPVDHDALRRRFAWALCIAIVASTTLVLLVYGLRADIRIMLTTPLFWAKVAFPMTLALFALALTARLARPAARIQHAASRLAGLTFPVFIVWMYGFALLWVAPPETRLSLLLGETWRSCSFNIAFLSVPGFIALFRAVRGLAPTRLRLAGAATGLLAGSTATIAYCLHCPEMSPSFWAVWYVLGMAIPTGLGALAGPLWLRW